MVDRSLFVLCLLVLGQIVVADIACSSIHSCSACTNTTNCAFCVPTSTCYPYPSSASSCTGPHAFHNESTCADVVVDCSSFSDCKGCTGDSSYDRCQWCVSTQTCDSIDTDASCKTGWTTSCSIFNLQLFYGSVVVFVGGVIGSGGGMGGGGLYLPVFLLILRLSAHVAIPLSKFTIFGVAVGGYVVTHSQRHPKVDKPLIDYDTSLILEPMTLAGSIFGVYLNVIFPAYLILVFLVLLLSLMAYRTMQKGMQLYREETAPVSLAAVASISSPNPTSPAFINSPMPIMEGDRTPVGLQATAPRVIKEERRNSAMDAHEANVPSEEPMEPQIGDEQDRMPLLVTPLLAKVDIPSYSSSPPEASPADPAKPKVSAPEGPHPNIDDQDEDPSPELLEVIEKQKGTPYIKIFYLWFVLAVTLGFQLLKGDGQNPSVVNIDCGTGGFWGTLLAPIPFLWISSYLFGKQLEREYAYKVKIGYKFAKGDVHWKNDPSVPIWRRPLISFPIYSTIAGVAAGFLGIGGGMVKGPLMMEMGVLSSVAVATSAYMIVFTATSTAGQFLILGRIAWQLALWYTAVGFVAAMVGQYGMVWMVKKYKKQSYVNFFLGSAIIVSVIAMVVTFGFQLKDDIDTNSNLSFHGVCGKPGD